MEEDNKEELIISKIATSYLLETGKWTKFLSVVGFIFVGFIVIIGSFAGILILASDYKDNNTTSILIGVVYLLIGIFYFFPVWYLFQFSKKLKSALLTKDSEELNIAFSNQKSFYKFWGVLLVITIVFYISIILFILFSYYLN